MAVSVVQIPVLVCPLCGGAKFAPAGHAAAYTVVQCESCRLNFLNPQPSDAELVEIYHPSYSFFGDEAGAAASVSRAKQATADYYLDLLAAASASHGRLLEVGCGDGDFLSRAVRRNFQVEGIDYSPHSCRKAQAKVGPTAQISCGEISLLADRHATFDLCVANDVIEHVRQPAVFLKTVFNLLRPDGWVFIVTPNLDSVPAKVLGSRWPEYKPEHLYYYTPQTLQRQLAQAGFADIRIVTGKKLLSLDYITWHFISFPVIVATPVLKFLRAVLPTSWSQRPWLMGSGGIIALARKPA